MRRIYVHIGTHKTGSTSLQKWLNQCKSVLAKQGYGIYQGMHDPENHIELYLASMRYDRDSFAKQSRPELMIDEQYTRWVASHVQRSVQECPHGQMLFTTEGLSLLRHDDELIRLREIFRGCHDRITFVLYLRNPEDYLRSYIQQLEKVPGRKRSKDYWSALYVEADTWLIQYEQLVDAYARTFGRRNLVVIDYDHEMQSHGNIIPSFARTIGCSLGRRERRLMDSFRFNVGARRGSTRIQKNDRPFFARIKSRLIASLKAFRKIVHPTLTAMSTCTTPGRE